MTRRRDQMRTRHGAGLIDAIVFDVGETLVDETRAWTMMAQAVGVTPFTLMAALGSVIERRQDHRQVWKMLGIENRPAMPQIEASDLYPDAINCVSAALDRGLVVGIAGNQPEGVVEQLKLVGFKPTFIASSAAWGVAKPSAEFFAKIIDACGSAPQRILYVGDRVDNDIAPAHAMGLKTALVRRGPWAHGPIFRLTIRKLVLRTYTSRVLMS